MVNFIPPRIEVLCLILMGFSLEEMHPGYSTLLQMHDFGHPRLLLRLGEEEGSSEYLANGSGL